MAALPVTTLLLILHWIQSHAAPTDFPTSEPTTEPTTEPSYNPTIEPTSNTTAPSPSPTTFPTITSPTLSFLKVICLENDQPITKYNMVLSEANGFHNNKYGIPSKGSLNIDDAWNIPDIQIPLSDSTNTCYLHIYLSNKDFWGYRSNATCTLSFDINKNNANIDDTTLNMYNILDINQKYNTFWNIKPINQDSLSFASYPTCQHLSNTLEENINFANENVKNFVVNSDFNSIIDGNNAEALISQTGLFPYFFYLATNQQQNDSQFRINHFPSQEACLYDQSLPTYDSANMSYIAKGGIDYYLFVNSTDQSSKNVSVNIEIQQICYGVIQPTIVFETTGEAFEEGKEKYKFPLTLAALILLSFVGCFILMGIANFFIWCGCAERKYENETEIQLGMLNNEDDMKIMEEHLPLPIEPVVETETMRFVVTEEDHEEMVDMLRKGSMSIGLQ